MDSVHTIAWWRPELGLRDFDCCGIITCGPTTYLPHTLQNRENQHVLGMSVRAVCRWSVVIFAQITERDDKAMREGVYNVQRVQSSLLVNQWQCTTSSLEGRGPQLNWENGRQSRVGSASYRHSSHWSRLPLGLKWAHLKSLDCLASDP